MTTKENITIRKGEPKDIRHCASIFHTAFTKINNEHGFPSEVPTEEDGHHRIEALFSDSGFHNFVAECDRHVVGSVFLDERSEVTGIGPISISPDFQGSRLGRMLMQAAIDRSMALNRTRLQLMQASFNTCSLSLYTKLGFAVQEPMAVMNGFPLVSEAIPGSAVHPATPEHLTAANTICEQVYGFDRSVELRASISRKAALVVAREGRITGYATGFGYLSHAVGESTIDIKALLASARNVDGAGVVIPTRNQELFQWCLTHGLRVVLPYTHMTMGFYREPIGAYMPSIHF